ncbi:glycoside hydrolase family 3 C-terminal domain-containing protein [Capnocytophaga sp.]|uniref:glycoside hydrolase family 3 C-terminal domain-containing protein n=1 Tax=Capnocytophaga sp. TaxID=44737 RepID=UPI0026DDAAEF|nr:glycoside hydrolase family 3 C-terminal domain-containing protein [Capnocytophaga sp.]MDO5105892.1 glycoside hydrolase family 3 C-terminal domain-containing protein [Capnocytophaga sp.]
MKRTLIKTFLALSLSTGLAAQQQLPTYLNDRAPIEERVEDALRRMTLEEKVAMCHAQSKFSSPGVPRLGIPENWMTDGPHGIRPEVLWDEWNQAGWTNDSCTAFPALTCLAASWNPKMAMLYGKSIGAEARYRNKNVLLGPGINIYRTPLNGRNFEYMGEDPYLASKMVVPYIEGVQSQGVAACVKHFALNNQEINRHTVNVIVDDRALYEIYLPAFKAAVQQGKTWSIMGAYNKYKDQWASQNKYLLVDILRKEWKFDGAVISDWGGVNNTEHAALHGLDIEFGTWTDGLTQNTKNAYDSYYLATPFLQKLKSGEISEEVVNEKARNILRLIFRTNMKAGRPYGSFASPEHFAAARKIGQEGIVLLKNEKNLLPLNLDKAKRIAIIGENAIKVMTVGGGSSSLKATHEVLPFDGLKARIGNKAEVVYARGYASNDYKDQDGVSANQNLTESRSEAELIAEAVKVAKTADYVIFVGGLNKHDGQDCEGNDRKSYGLPYGQDAVISALAKANKNLIVVLISGNAVAMPWVEQVPAIVQNWYLGSEAGNALADILSGDVNPSGKLPFTFPVKLEDNGAHAMGEYPGAENETYREGILVGYRWADTKNIKPLFPFGHGLSYTTFRYANATLSKKTMTADESLIISVSIKNTGSKSGAEVVQLYIRDVKSSVLRPYKELKGFEKVYLKAGESKTVTFTIDKEALSFFDDKKHEWVAESGDFEVLLGSSSKDIRAKTTFTLQ